MEPVKIRVTFPFQPGEEDDDPSERFAFWDSPDTVTFFRERGYTLYQRFPSGEVSYPTRPALPIEEPAEPIYPYAFYDTQTESVRPAPLLTNEFSTKVVFAQDSLNRHVAIKLVRDGTDEYRILRFLSEQNLETLKENCVIPVLDLLPIENFWFAVMPRWGSDIHLPKIESMRDVIDIIHSMLKGLAFLHEHNISHGDIRTDNVLVNHFTDMDRIYANTVRQELRFQRRLAYAMFDFDFSIMLSPEADKTTFRLPYKRSWGTFALVKDTYQGEFDYNPFVFDVGNLGVTFCDFQHLTKEVPMLAPLIDRMTTRTLRNRFTASQALEFFEQLALPQSTQAQLNATIQMDDPAQFVLYDRYDRWQHVPPDFAKKWAAFREPPIPLSTKALRWFCQTVTGYAIVANFRWFVFKLKLLPRKIFTNFVGLKNPLG